MCNIFYFSGEYQKFMYYFGWCKQFLTFESHGMFQKYCNFLTGYCNYTNFSAVSNKKQTNT